MSDLSHRPFASALSTAAAEAGTGATATSPGSSGTGPWVGMALAPAQRCCPPGTCQGPPQQHIGSVPRELGAQGDPKAPRFWGKRWGVFLVSPERT